VTDPTGRAAGSDARRALLLIFGMPFIMGAVYYGGLAIAVARSRFSWQQMDWNGDGRTTPAEYFQTADVIERPVERDGRPCVELVWTRKGTVLRTECPAAP
jgi:hypothetical protein